MPRQSDRPLIYLIGTSGWPNYGDELITAAWLRFYAEHMPDADVWLDSQRPGQSFIIHGDCHPRLGCTDTLYHACWNAPSTTPDDIVEFGRSVVRTPGLIPREVLGVDLFMRADIIHVIGGGFVNSMWPQHYALLGAVEAAAERTGARTLMTGAGLLPAEGAHDTLRSILARFNVVEVRDAPSFELLHGAVPALSRGADDVFLDLRGIPQNRADQPHTVLCLQEDLLAAERSHLVDYVVRTLDHWGVRTDPVLLLECLPPGDLTIGHALEQQVPELVRMPFSQLWAGGFPVARGQRWISTRYHPHLLAAAAGVWGVALPSIEYYRTKHESLVEMGSGWTIAQDLDTPVDPGALPGAPFRGQVPAFGRTKRELVTSVLSIRD